MNSYRNLHQPTGRKITLNNLEYLFFGGTAYLGLLVNQEYQELVKKGIDLYGLNNGTSRSNNIQLGIYEDAEQVLASRFGWEETALFSSGYLAAQATVKSLVSYGKVYYAPHSHPALWVAEKPTTLADNFDVWISKLVEEINHAAEENFVVISNAIDNLRPELYDFTPLKNINPSKRVILILDDSHGLGIVNKNNISANIDGLQTSANIDLVIVASLAKGFGTDAGIVLGRSSLLKKIKTSPIFLGASPSSPAFIYALIKSVSIYDEAFDKLHNNIEYLATRLSPKFGLSHIERFPVFTSVDSTLYDYLSKNGALISSFPYPLATSPLLNRIVVSSLHEQDDLCFLSNLLHNRV